jgi:hypothetical protein
MRGGGEITVCASVFAWKTMRDRMANITAIAVEERDVFFLGCMFVPEMSGHG